MSKVIETERTLEMLVNCKTYPAISKKYTETVCTGGVEPDGRFVRLYPIPFRFLDEEERYERWDVIRVRAYRDTKDPRPESWHLEPGTPIERIGNASTDRQRWDWMKRAVFPSRRAMTERGLTNGLVEVEPLEFYWKPDEKEWTPAQRTVLEQGDLFAEPAAKAVIAERVPWQFRLRFREAGSTDEDDGKVLQWSLYQGYRRFLRCGGEQVALETVAERVRKSIFNPDRRVFAIFGTHSRYGFWMISGLYHVPIDVIESRRGAKQLF